VPEVGCSARVSWPSLASLNPHACRSMCGWTVNAISERWSCFLRQAAKVDSAMKRVIHHEDAETVFG